MRSHPEVVLVLIAACAPVRTAYVVERPDMIAEGIAFDASTRRLFVGSEYLGEIDVVEQDGSMRPFTTGLPGVLGLRVDGAHHLLWAATNGEPGSLTVAQWHGQSFLMGVDLAAGSVVRRVPLSDGGQHLLNDVAVAEDGTAYVTDSESGGVWRATPSSSALEPFVPAGSLSYPNGIALGAAALYVADNAGISRIDDRGAVHRLAHAADVDPRGIDGMYACGTSLVGIQNARKPWHVTRFELDAAGDRLVSASAIDVGSLPSPTTGALDGASLLVVANSDIDAFGDKGLTPGDRPHTRIVRLDGICRKG